MLAISNDAPTAESFEAWKFGPVLPSVYHATKNFGAANISSYLPEYVNGKYVNQVVGPTAKTFHSVFDQVWENYIGIPAIVLSTMTHLANTPWHKTKVVDGNIIPNELIKEYFLGLSKSAPLMLARRLFPRPDQLAIQEERKFS